MWGSTKANTADECTWANTPFNGGNTGYSPDAFNLVKNTVCPNGVLAKGYDAATQIMGDDWRMPTKAEIQELLKNTIQEWVEDYNGSGVKGMKFISKTDESKYIFIPAAGYCKYGSVHSVGNISYFWSSSLFTSYANYAWYLGFDSVGCSMYYDDRYCGMSVRGVRE